MPPLLFLDSILAKDPTALALQFGVLALGSLLLFLLFWTLKDSLLRSQSLFFHVFALLLVTALPLFGFLVYLLIRPSRTLRERETERLLHMLLKEVQQARKQHPSKKGKE